MIRMALFILFMVSIGWSDTINSASKNPSMAVLGTQRLPTDINVTAGGGAEPGTYAYFNMASCPSGWVAANGANGTVDLRGTFIRSLDSGRGLDPSRSRGSYQADDLKSHTHNISTGMGSSDGSAPYPKDSSGWARTWTVTSTATGGAETRPKNVALLACMKQ